MKNLEVNNYRNDIKSLVTYLGQAKTKQIVLQRTESTLCLLDVVFETILEDGHPAEFFIRLETPMERVVEMKDMLIAAIENPVPHPWHDDIFDKALAGKTPRERMYELINKSDNAGHT